MVSPVRKLVNHCVNCDIFLFSGMILKQGCFMNSKYMKAMNLLYGEKSEQPAPTVPSASRSFSPEQKKRLKSHPRRRLEEVLQIKLVLWLWETDLPVHSIPNEGNRGALATHRLKQMGLRPGASDLFLSRMRGGYGGFYIELKSPGEKPRANQIEFMEDMRREGYKAEWFDNLAEAQQSIRQYLGL
jgi:VRR-NUC domain-containing protein